MKKHRRVMSHDTEEWCKVWRKTDSWFQKWHEKFGECQFNEEFNEEFNAIRTKSTNLQFDVLLLSITYKVTAKKVQRNYLSWKYVMFELKRYRGDA